MAIPTTLADTYGALFLGVCISGLLLGITCLQLYLFFDRFPKEPAFTRIAVAVMGLLDTTAFALNLHALYHYMFANGSELNDLLSPVWSLKLSIMISDILVSGVQTLYCIRLWKFASTKRFLPFIVTIAVLGGWASCLMNGIQGLLLKDFLQIQPERTTVIYIPFTVATAVDIVISGVTCYYLYTTMPRFSPTRSIVDELIVWVITTGSLTSVSAAVVLVLYIAMPDTLAYLAYGVCYSKLYLCNYLAMMNTREKLRYKLKNADVIALNTVDWTNETIIST